MKTNEITRREGYIKFIAYLQIIGIILVVAGHSLHEYPDGNHGWSTLFYRAFLSFRMPLFMFVSGFLMVYTTKIFENATRKPKEFIINKIKRLLLPFVVLTAITFVPRSVLDGMADDAFQLSAHTFLLAFLDREHNPIPFFWFLQASFFMLAITYTILYASRKNNRLNKAILLLILLSFAVIYFIPYDVTTFWALDKIKALGVFFLMGCCYCAYAPLIDSVIPWTKVWFLVVSVVVWVGCFALFENTQAAILCSIAGIVMCISFARILEEREWGFLDHLQGANYIIFLLSWYCNVASQQVLAHFVTLPWWVHTALSLISGIYVPWLGYKYLEKHQDSRWVKVTAFLLGQSFRKKK
mgnify:CR=1 FL=1|jgi:Fucose 4-O-acetylase and related acetyltransferases